MCKGCNVVDVYTVKSFFKEGVIELDVQVKLKCENKYLTKGYIIKIIFQLNGNIIIRVSVKPSGKEESLNLGREIIKRVNIKDPINEYRESKEDKVEVLKREIKKINDSIEELERLKESNENENEKRLRDYRKGLNRKKELRRLKIEEIKKGRGVFRRLTKAYKGLKEELEKLNRIIGELEVIEKEIEQKQKNNKAVKEFEIEQKEEMLNEKVNSRDTINKILENINKEKNIHNKILENYVKQIEEKERRIDRDIGRGGMEL